MKVERRRDLKKRQISFENRACLGSAFNDLLGDFMKYETCAICKREATHEWTPILQTLPPDDPQGFVNPSIFGVRVKLCKFHRLSHQVIEIKPV